MARALAGLASILLAGVLVAGCGDDDASGEAADGATDAAATPNGADLGDGGEEPDTGGSPGLPVFCDLVTAEQVGEAVGATVTTSTGPFDACEFGQEDPRALSGSLGATDLGAGAGGYETYQSGTSGSLDSPVRAELDGLGDAAYVDLGTVAGGENLQVAGGVLVGQVLYTLNLSQGAGMGEAELTAIAERLLQLMLDAA